MKVGNENSRVKANFPLFSSITTGRFSPPFPAPPLIGHHCSVFTCTNACTLLWFRGAIVEEKHSIQDKNVGLVCVYDLHLAIDIVLLCQFNQVT